MPKSFQKKMDIQMYDPGESLTRVGFVRKLCDELGSLGCKTRVHVRRTFTEVDKNMPLIVLCYQMSRVETDVDKAMKEVFADDTIRLDGVVIAVVHEKDAHALTSARSRNDLLDKKYDNVGLIVDIAFGKNGIYQCPMNDEARQSLFQFFERHPKEESPAGEDFEKVSLKPMLQLFCQRDSEWAPIVLDELFYSTNDLAQQFEVEKLTSLFDRDMSQPLVAVLAPRSVLHEELILSTACKKVMTILVLLPDSASDAGVEEHGELKVIHMSEACPGSNLQSVLECYKQHLASPDTTMSLFVSVLSKIVEMQRLPFQQFQRSKSSSQV